MPAIRTVDEISDEELEDCFDGTTNIDMVRELCELCENNAGYVDIEEFGERFATAIEGFIGADADDEPDEWQEAWDNNREWGEGIAENINEALDIEEPEEYKE
jgi:broad specificity phosphatase PhoE